MPPPWARWNWKHLAIAIAALALSFASVGIEATVVGTAFCLPTAIAPPGRRIASLHWVMACYPLLVLLSLYLTWGSAWVALGHRPRSTWDDPKDIDAILAPYALTSILLFGIPIALISAVGLTVGRLLRAIDGKAGDVPLSVLLGFAPLAWVGGYVLLRWDPVRVLGWYMD